MSRQVGHEGNSAEFVCRIPSLPDLDRTYSLVHTNESDVDAIPDFNTSIEAGSGLPMLCPKLSPKLPYLEANVIDSTPKPSESSRGGFVSLGTSGLSIRNPRDFEDIESSSRPLWNVTKQRGIVAKRPKPIYPRGLTEAKIASRRQSYHETPSSRASVEGASSPCEVTPYIPSDASSPSVYQIQNNIFIPIREADTDFLAQEQPSTLLLSRTRLDHNATPPPRLTLRPRGKQASLALDKYFP